VKFNEEEQSSLEKGYRERINQKVLRACRSEGSFVIALAPYSCARLPLCVGAVCGGEHGLLEMSSLNSERGIGDSEFECGTF